MTSLDALPRATLAVVGREYMLFGHLLNRAGLPVVHQLLGPAAREQVAIEEWMGASPIYNRRMRRCLRFDGDDVGTIFKGFQLDVGFPHQYMDVRYRLVDPQRGVFWLEHCGALLEVEKHGEAAVFSMCHTIEDPTFDASAVATNPRARCRPIHRPPRVPADRAPHCHWEVFIDPDAEPLREVDITTAVRRSRLARTDLPLAAIDDGTGGWDDYDRPFDPDFRLERLSRAALVRVCGELLVQCHLLVRALLLSVAARADEATVRRVGTAQWIAAGAVAAGRLRRVLGIAGDDARAIAEVVAIHPAFLPGYAGVGVRATSPDRARLWIEDGDAFAEGDPYAWAALLGDAPHPALDATVRAVNPRARCVPTTPAGGERLAWDVVVDATAEPAPPDPLVSMVAATNAGAFVFRD